MGLPKDEQQARVLESGVKRITLSFYRYVRIADPKRMQSVLQKRLEALDCYGRIYLASEGINAQMNVPEKNWREFDLLIQSIPEFCGVPYKIAVEETDKVSFYRLSIRVRRKIVADGLDDTLFDATKTGAYLSAEEINAYIEDPEAIVVDMRNGYESEVGHFERAITPDVDTFREGIRILPSLLGKYKNKKIALYCTGGIRCEKASAWLRHNGFADVRHLRGGIIEYAHEVKRRKLPNRFKGKNFVFDERLGERISNEVIAHCHLCRRERCDNQRHCANKACHTLFICCPKCLEKMRGYCSYGCWVFDSLPRCVKKFFTRNDYKKKAGDFKKRRLRYSG